MAPQSRHLVPSYRVAQCGQTAPVWKLSKAFPHFPHFQYSPIGGLDWHDGQAYSNLRGNFAKRNKARACCNPPQQFMSKKTAIAPSQISCVQNANPMKAAMPAIPSTVANSRLRARPITNQSKDRRI